MKNPCKKCIVRAACTKKCREYDSFVHIASQVITIISLMLSTLIVGPGLLYLSLLSDQGEAWVNLLITCIWVCSFCIVVILQAPFKPDTKTSFVANVIFAPVIALCMIFFYIAKPFCKSSVLNEKEWDNLF